MVLLMGSFRIMHYIIFLNLITCLLHNTYYITYLIFVLYLFCSSNTLDLWYKSQRNFDISPLFTADLFDQELSSNFYIFKNYKTQISIGMSQISLKMLTSISLLLMASLMIVESFRIGDQPETHLEVIIIFILKFSVTMLFSLEKYIIHYIP